MNRAKARRMRHEPGNTDVFGAEPSRRRVNLRLVMMLAMILMVVGGIIALSVTLPDKPAATAVSNATLGRTVPSLANNSGIRNPKPNQYDPLTDRYWHVTAGGNGHWHKGQPSANAGTLTPGFNPATIVSSGSLSSPNPNIPNPTPGQYDPLTDQYWHVPVGGNAHWHKGKPAANDGTATVPNSGSLSSANPNIPNPTPGQYDPVTGRYWHVPEGGNPHWHKGRPPAEGNP